MGDSVDLDEEAFQVREPPLGEWPPSPSVSPGLSVAYDIPTHQPLPNVHIVLVPTDDPTTVPAHLHWGDWNECPAPAYHVAALRHWREHYGAELVGLHMDVMNLRVARKPATRDEALELARPEDIGHRTAGARLVVFWVGTNGPNRKQDRPQSFGR